MQDMPVSRTECLRLRKQHCVCKYCGHELMIERLVFSLEEDARIELVCKHCQRIEYGVEKEIYQAAQYYIDEIGFNYFQTLNSTAQTRQMNIAKVAELITWGMENLGYLQPEGFVYPLQTDKLVLSEALHLSAKDLARSEEAQP